MDATSGNLFIAFKLVVYNGAGDFASVVTVDRRTKEGLSKPEIMRCIKRYLAREVYHALVADLEAVHAT